MHLCGSVAPDDVFLNQEGAVPALGAGVRVGGVPVAADVVDVLASVRHFPVLVVEHGNAAFGVLVGGVSGGPDRGYG